MSLDSFVSECVCTGVEHSVPHSDVFPVEACSLPQTRLCPCAGSQKPRSGLSCSPGPFGSRRCVRCLCTELVRLKWEFGLYPVIPIQTHACRINYNTSENLNIMVRFHFSPSFSEAISLLWRPDWSLWIGPRFHTFKRLISAVITCKSLVRLVLGHERKRSCFLLDDFIVHYLNVCVWMRLRSRPWTLCCD